MSTPSGGDKIIKKVVEFKYLGLVLDPKLSWETHIEHIQRKMSFLYGVRFRVKPIVPRKALLKLYFGCIQSHLQYPVIAWAMPANLNSSRYKSCKLDVWKSFLFTTIIFYATTLYSNHAHISQIRDLCEFQTCWYYLKKTHLLQLWLWLADSTNFSSGQYHWGLLPSSSVSAYLSPNNSL